MFSPGLDGRIRNCCPEPKLRKSSYGTVPFTLINDFFSFWCTQSAFLILCFPVVKSKLVLWIQIRYLEIGSGSRSSTGLVSVFCEFMSKILHLLPLFYPIFTIKKFTCLDPSLYSEYGYGSTKLLNTYPDPQHCRDGHSRRPKALICLDSHGIHPQKPPPCCTVYTPYNNT